jgi:hypothetical protein
MHFAFDLAVNDQVVGEFDRTFDFDIVGKDVFAGGHRRIGTGGCALRLGGLGRGGEDGGAFNGRRGGGLGAVVFRPFVGLSDDLPEHETVLYGDWNLSVNVALAFFALIEIKLKSDG